MSFVLRRWKILRVVCSVPFVCIFFCWKIIPESPRWLLSKGRLEESKEILRKIAKTNGTSLPKNFDSQVESIARETNTPSYGYFSLLSSWYVLHTCCTLNSLKLHYCLLLQDHGL